VRRGERSSAQGCLKAAEAFWLGLLPDKGASGAADPAVGWLARSQGVAAGHRERRPRCSPRLDSQGGDGSTLRRGSCHRTLGSARCEDWDAFPVVGSFARSGGEGRAGLLRRSGPHVDCCGRRPAATDVRRAGRSARRLRCYSIGVSPGSRDAFLLSIRLRASSSSAALPESQSR
jgi:hypothetical protein